MKRTLCMTLAIALPLTLALTACAKGGSDAGNAGNAGNSGNSGDNYTVGGNMMTPSDFSEGPDGGYQSWYDAALAENSGIKPGDLVENAWQSTAENPVSTFSSDVDTASYSQFRMLVNSGCTLSDLTVSYGASLRTEEMLNYFEYAAADPEGDDLFGLRAEISECPWNRDAMLLMLNLKAKTVPEKEESAGNNLVFLVDVSGSMDSEDKLPLLKQAFRVLTDNLTERDRVSVVTYASGESVVLEGCPGNQRERILSAIDSLEAGGSTNGSAGMKKAYEIAGKYKIEGGNNRILLATDGDFNVGISTPKGICSYVSEMRSTGIYISTLGFGWVYNDSMMETIADNGNGAYYFIDSAAEAERVFAEDLLSTLYTVAEDVKFQLTFDPAAVEKYRLIGYENRLLDREDFTDDSKDAGELGAGQTITVCYELSLTGAAGAAGTSEPAWMTLAVRYKDPGSAISVSDEYAVGADACTDEPSGDFRFACCVIETALLLHESRYAPGLTPGQVRDLLGTADLSGDPRRSEFAGLIGRLTDGS